MTTEQTNSYERPMVHDLGSLAEITSSATADILAANSHSNAGGNGNGIGGGVGGGKGH